jgi:hypothetical protein
MITLFGKLAFGVLGGVLAMASSVYAQNALFTPIVPCRIIDTRNAGGPIPDGTTRSFFVAGTSGFTQQGGTSGGCGIPFPAAVAAVINYTVVTPVSPFAPFPVGGNLRVTPFGTAVPLASIINWQAGTIAIANGIATKLCGAESCESDITIQVDSFDGTTHGSTHLVADVMGYYRAGLIVNVQDDPEFGLSLLPGSTAGTSVNRVTNGQYHVKFPFDVSKCAGVASAVTGGGIANVQMGTPSNDQATVFIVNFNAGNLNFLNVGFSLAAVCS